MTFKQTLAATLGLSLAALAAPALAADHVGVTGEDQSTASGTVMADKIMADANGWMVVHRVKPDGKPGPVVGHAPLMKGENSQVVAILTEPVEPGAKLMLMLHGEEGGSRTGIFEYTLGAKEDGPVKVDGKLVMAVITAK